MRNSFNSLVLIMLETLMMLNYSLLFSYRHDNYSAKNKAITVLMFV